MSRDHNTSVHDQQINRETEAGQLRPALYVPSTKKNHTAMTKLQKEITSMWKRYEILGSEFFQLTNAETFRGFTNLAETVSANPDEEVWVEIQRYKSREHRDSIVAKIREDSVAGPLCGRFYELVTPGKNSIMADFNRLTV
ncbi:MAG TPA: DUF1428 family protein [Candidatus Bathyarchaeia archaeon]|nr:DUF1428 family protein [Candidatus Bathyarchaeia archaeon]